MKIREGQLMNYLYNINEKVTKKKLKSWVVLNLTN